VAAGWLISLCKTRTGAGLFSASGLMAGAEAGPVVAVEVFVEQEQIPPVGVFLEASGFRWTGIVARTMHLCATITGEAGARIRQSRRRH
jgi:hypothetical protein